MNNREFFTFPFFRTVVAIGVIVLLPILTAAEPTKAKHWRAGSELPDGIQKIFPVGHRGAPKHAPENTIPSHEAALALSARMIELDVRYTKDGPLGCYP